jgi:hypothetical protein
MSKDTFKRQSGCLKDDYTVFKKEYWNDPKKRDRIRETKNTTRVHIQKLCRAKILVYNIVD